MAAEDACLLPAAWPGGTLCNTGQEAAILLVALPKARVPETAAWHELPWHGKIIAKAKRPRRQSLPALQQQAAPLGQSAEQLPGQCLCLLGKGDRRAAAQGKKQQHPVRHRGLLQTVRGLDTSGQAVAVREGFEPSTGANLYTLSRRAPSAARTPHRKRGRSEL